MGPSKILHARQCPAMRGIGILAILAGVRLIWQKVRNKAPSPIGMILLSAVLGALLYQ